MSPSILITGASTGIGASAAQHLAQRGWLTFAGVRRQEDADRIAALHPNLRPLLLDVTQPNEICSAVQAIRAETGPAGLDALFNNAGIAVGGPVELVAIEDVRRQIEINYTAQLAVTQACLPLIRQARGRIVFNGSVSGLVSSPFISPYSSSKFALEALADALRIELRPWGIKVVIIEAGNIATPIWNKSLGEFAVQSQSYPPEAIPLYGWVLEPMQKKVGAKPKGLDPLDYARLLERILTLPRPNARYTLAKGAWLYPLLRLLPARLLDQIVWRRIPKPEP